MKSTRGKAVYHLQRAEYWQRRVNDFEKAAERKAEGQEEGRMARDDNSRLEISFIADGLLKNHHGYKVAVGNRNAHQTQAKLYMLAVAAGIEETWWDQTEHGLVYKGPMAKDEELREPPSDKVDDGL